MKQRKCPHCGEYVQNNCLTCPKCFKEIPRKQQDVEYIIKEDAKKRSNKVPTAAVLLSVIPPFAGLLGLGLIYMNPKDSKGYWFLAAGLLLFLSFLALFFLMLDSGFFSALLLFVSAVVLLLIYISGAIAALLETLFGSVFKILKF